LDKFGSKFINLGILLKNILDREIFFVFREKIENGILLIFVDFYIFFKVSELLMNRVFLGGIGMLISLVLDE